METLLKVEVKQHSYIFSIILYIFLKLKVDDSLRPTQRQKRDSSVAIMIDHPVDTHTIYSNIDRYKYWFI
jgi:hypothetical protein